MRVYLWTLFLDVPVSQCITGALMIYSPLSLSTGRQLDKLGGLCVSVCYCLFCLTFVYFSVCVSFVCSFLCVCLRVFVSVAVGLAAGVTTDLVAVYPVKVVPDRNPG